MAKPFQPTMHPVLGLPSVAQAMEMGERAWKELMVRREQIIADEKADPLRHMWQPPIWRVCDALLGLPWVEAGWAERMRQRLGFPRPVRTVLVLGGNRAGKSQWASNRTMKILYHYVAAKAWALHSNLQMSRDYQQPLFYRLLPANLKAQDVKGKVAYVAYKQKTGFSDEQFVLPPQRAGAEGAACLFKSYDQDKGSIEGGNLNVVWGDELLPSDWLETLELRVAEKNGWVIVTFTPVEGYTETVRMMCDGAETVQESIAYLCPDDGGEPDVARALGLDEAELAEIKRAAVEGRAAMCPQSRPEDCEKWLTGEPSQPAEPEGRRFKRVPRVLKCVDPEERKAVVYFHSSDNPYGNPRSVWETIASKGEEFIQERFYGIAHKTMSVRFKKFNRKVHVIPPRDIPKEGTNYHFTDPCSGRNFFQKWYRVTPDAVYLYREWPGAYVIPGVGMPGPWALPDGRHPDGKRGPAQKPFGWGYLRYKEELARLEGWQDYAKLEKLTGEERKTFLLEMSDTAGAREKIQERYLDSRFASTPKMERDRPVTMLEEFADIGVYFSPTPGDDIDEGVTQIQDALDYDEARPVDFFNRPKFYISSECHNTIFSLTTWTGYTREGRRNLEGASKDPVDLDRYFFLSDCPYLGGVTEDEDGEGEDGRNYY